MIYDDLSNAKTYQHVKPGIGLALEYVRKTDFANVANGKYELDGANVFAMVQRYRTRRIAEAIWESHRKYIDVQFVFQGEEQLRLCAAEPGPGDYDAV